MGFLISLHSQITASCIQVPVGIKPSDCPCFSRWVRRGESSYSCVYKCPKHWVDTQFVLIASAIFQNHWFLCILYSFIKYSAVRSMHIMKYSIIIYTMHIAHTHYDTVGYRIVTIERDHLVVLAYYVEILFKKQLFTINRLSRINIEPEYSILDEKSFEFMELSQSLKSNPSVI